MKVAFTHNLRLTDVRETEKEAEYDSAETVSAIATALEVAGHEVEKVEVSGPASNLLERLEQIDPEQAKIVELRYFAGLAIEEAAEALGMSPATVKRRWALARAWLFRELSNTR